MIRLKIRDNYFRIIDGYNVSESSREVKFSNLKIDFTDKTLNDLPKKYQECQLIEIDYVNRLPKEYVEVEYIQSNRNQYIDTGVNADNKLRVVSDMAYLDTIVTSNGSNIGAIKSVGSGYVRYHLLINGNEWKIFYSNASKTFGTVDLNRHIFDLDAPNKVCKIDETISDQVAFTSFDTGLNFWLFGRNSNSNNLKAYSAQKLYSCKMYYDSVLIRDFVPCYRRSDGKTGLYDLITNTFFASQGTQEFSYGDRVKATEKEKVIYTGYISNYILPNMKNEIEYRELEIELLSPLSIATVRTVDAVGTYNLQELIKELIQPLIDDGFILKELNIGNNQITVNYLNETIESSLNKLSNKFNFWWYIDANKNIYINSITYLMSLIPKLTYDDNHPIKGLIDVIPSIDATDYCNVVNFTNVRMYIESYIHYEPYQSEKKVVGFYPLFESETLNTGDEIEFNHPIDISPKAILNMYNSSNNDYSSKFALLIYATSGDIEELKLGLKLDDNNKLIIPNNVSISDSYSTDNTWVLVRDPFFENLIVGLKYNGQPFEIYTVLTLTSLVWAKISVKNNIEINKNKEIINKSGIVEKIIDMNETWRTYNELIMIANSYIKINTSKADTVKLKMDEEIDLKIGDTVKINKNSFLIDDIYIITDKSSIYDDNVHKWNYTLKNTNALENYVDLFRAKEDPENTEKKINLITSDYIEEEIKEKYEVIINEN